MTGGLGQLFNGNYAKQHAQQKKEIKQRKPPSNWRPTSDDAVDANELVCMIVLELFHKYLNP